MGTEVYFMVIAISVFALLYFAYALPNNKSSSLALPPQGRGGELYSEAKKMLDSDTSDYNPAKAVALLEKASEAGDLDARLELARCTAHGIGVERNYPAAITVIRTMANKGHLGAQYELAQELIYEGLSDNRSILKEDTVSLTDAEGVMWLRRAASAGHGKAQASLSVCCSNGIGMARNPSEAFHWANKAAIQGCASGQFALARAYANGEGVRQDLRSAYVWFMVGRSNPDARFGSKMYDPVIAQIRRYLSPKDISECEARIVAIQGGKLSGVVNQSDL